MQVALAFAVVLWFKAMTQDKAEKRSFGALPRSLSIGIAMAAIGSIAIMSYFLNTSFNTAPPPTPREDRPVRQAVTALGRLEPKGEVIQLSAAESSGSNRLASLLVQQGDIVKPKQMIAVLDSHDLRQAALEQAQQQVGVARAKLAQIKAGAKIGEIDTQRAVIARFRAELRREAVAKNAVIAGLKAEVQNAKLEFSRFDSLEVEGAASKSIRDGKKLALDTTKERLHGAIASRDVTLETLKESIRGAEATLHSIAEIRPVDIKLAQREVDSASAAVQKAKADLELSNIRASREGTILKIQTWPGEIISSKGIVEIGQTQAMYAVAEIYELDINKIKVGQKAKITCLNFPEKLQGTVEQVGLLVAKKDVLNTDPAAEIDSRVVEVKIRLDPEDSHRVAGLSNAKVKVAIPI
jgi:HlyD family secretion protein